MFDADIIKWTTQWQKVDHKFDYFSDNTDKEVVCVESTWPAASRLSEDTVTFIAQEIYTTYISVGASDQICLPSTLSLCTKWRLDHLYVYGPGVFAECSQRLHHDLHLVYPRFTTSLQYQRLQTLLETDVATLPCVEPFLPPVHGNRYSTPPAGAMTHQPTLMACLGGIRTPSPSPPPPLSNLTTITPIHSTSKEVDVAGGGQSSTCPSLVSTLSACSNSGRTHITPSPPTTPGTFSTLLGGHHIELYDSFLSFLEKRYCSENLHCYCMIGHLEVLLAKSVSPTDKAVYDMSVLLYLHCIADGSTWEVSICSEEKRKLLLHVASPCYSTLLTLKKTLEKTLHQQWLLYVKTQPYAHLMERLQQCQTTASVPRATPNISVCAGGTGAGRCVCGNCCRKKDAAGRPPSIHAVVPRGGERGGKGKMERYSSCLPLLPSLTLRHK